MFEIAMLGQLAKTVFGSSAVIVMFCLAEMLIKKHPQRSWNDSFIDLVTFAITDVLVHPVVVFVVAYGAAQLCPQYSNTLEFVPWWTQLLCFLMFEDMVNYWFHRAAHTYPKIWPLHMAHHTSPYMSASITHRNSVLYNFLFPNLWAAAVLVYLGFGQVFIFYSIVKNVVLCGAHSELRWDAVLYKYKFFHPVAWVIERTISTPATHFAHHAEREDDDIGHYNGNYSNLLFFWDVIFGTAKITRRYPPSFGMTVNPAHGPVPWHTQLLFPLTSVSRLWKQPQAEPPESV